MKRALLALVVVPLPLLIVWGVVLVVRRIRARREESVSREWLNGRRGL